VSEDLGEVLDWIRFVRPEGGVSMKAAIGEKRDRIGSLSKRLQCGLYFNVSLAHAL